MANQVVIPEHVLGGRRIGVELHQCLECGFRPNVFCPWCYGEGTMTTDQLARWQRKADAAAFTDTVAA